MHAEHPSLAERAKAVFTRVDRRSGGVLGIIVESYTRFVKARGTESSASLAFYAFFSLFPLLLSLIAIGSFFLESERIQLEVLHLVRVVIPVSPGVIVSNIQEVLKARTTIGIISAIGLIWSASSALDTLFRNINRAWITAKPLNTIASRLASILVVAVFGVVLLISLLSSAVLSFFPQLDALIGQKGTLVQSPAWVILSKAGTALVMLVVFMVLYRWAPNTYVLWREAFWGALVASIAWQLTTAGFTFYLHSGLSQYKLVYGSLGAIVALLFWIYLNNLIIIYCAHLSACIAQHRRHVVSQITEPEVGSP